ncbi:MAG: thiamine phosphate synthase [Thermomicrobiales bacterium]
MQSPSLCKRLLLYVIVDPAWCALGAQEVARQAVSGGATALQLRSKSLSDRENFALAQELRVVTRDRALLIINDRVDIALASGADGVHLGVDDLPVAAAREIGGPGLLIGYSPETDEQTIAAKAAGADYLGVGPVFGTSSKLDAGPATGTAILSVRQKLSGLPIVGIGGINVSNAKSVIAAGACGVSVMSAVIGDRDPLRATRELYEVVTGDIDR